MRDTPKAVEIRAPTKRADFAAGAAGRHLNLANVPARRLLSRNFAAETERIRLDAKATNRFANFCCRILPQTPVKGRRFKYFVTQRSIAAGTEVCPRGDSFTLQPWTVESEKELKRSKEKLPYIGRFPAISRSRHTKGDYRDTTVTRVTRNFRYPTPSVR